jgi:cysteine synthase A
MMAGVAMTPMVRLEANLAGVRRTLLLKLESSGPGTSIKDRTALALIDDLERSRRLQPGATVVESTSGNLGVALAHLCAVRGYRLIAVVDPRTSESHVETMRSLGARIELVTTPDEHHGFLLSRLDRVRQVLRDAPGSVWTNQYENPANPRIHFQRTGPEILRQCASPPDAVYVAVSTGGTLAGIARCFEAVAPVTLVVGVDMVGSRALGGSAGRRLLTGIGSSRVSTFVPPSLMRRAAFVADAEAIAACVRLEDAAGLRLGGSSGAVLAACLRHLGEHDGLVRVVCVCPDGGDRYAETIYSAEWRKRHGIDVGGISVPGIDGLERVSGDDGVERGPPALSVGG